MYIYGSDFMFYIIKDGQPVGICHSNDCIIEATTEELQTTGPNDGRWGKFIPGQNTYTISVPGITVYSDDMNSVNLHDYQDNGSVIEWKASDAEEGGLQYSGQMFITRLSRSSLNTDINKFEMDARGTGPLQVIKAPYIKDVYLSNLFGVRLPGCPNPYPCMILWYDGTIIGLANNADDVITLFNQYDGNQYYQLIGTDTGCNFTMSIAWNSPERPDWVPAEQGAGFVLGRTGAVGDNDVIGQTGEVGDNNVIGPIEYA